MHGAVHLLAYELDGDAASAASSLPGPRRLDSPAAWQQAQQEYVARLNVSYQRTDSLQCRFDSLYCEELETQGTSSKIARDSE